MKSLDEGESPVVTTRLSRPQIHKVKRLQRFYGFATRSELIRHLIEKDAQSAGASLPHLNDNDDDKGAGQ